jgi:hypothetical protein
MIRVTCNVTFDSGLRETDKDLFPGKHCKLCSCDTTLETYSVLLASRCLAGSTQYSGLCNSSLFTSCLQLGNT